MVSDGMVVSGPLAMLTGRISSAQTHSALAAQHCKGGDGMAGLLAFLLLRRWRRMPPNWQNCVHQQYSGPSVMQSVHEERGARTDGGWTDAGVEGMGGPPGRVGSCAGADVRVLRAHAVCAVSVGASMLVEPCVACM